MKDKLQSIAALLLHLFAAATLMCILVPLLPSMPAQGLDPSWHYGLNQAVAQGLSFGREIVFTFGPYASIYTRAFNPATDGLMIWGSVYFSVAFILAIALALRERPKIFLLILVAAFAFVGAIPYALYSPRDPFIFFYPLLVSVYLCGGFKTKNELSSGFDLLATSLLLSVFGLIALTKISTFLLCGACLVFILGHLLWHREYARAAAAALSPLATLVILWMLSGQSVADLPLYFQSMVPIVSGYSDAMSLAGNTLDIVAYLLAFLTVPWVLLRDRQSLKTNVLLIGILYSLSMFVVFKAAFVRHDNHAFMAGNFLVLVGVLLFVALPSRRSAASLFICFTAFLVIANNHLPLRRTLEPENLFSVYTTAWRGLEVRLSAGNQLLASFEEARSILDSKADIPYLPGTTDIYSWEQSRLLAGDNIWNPRPTFQSYTVYTASLARANKEHLHGGSAPDNIVFKIHPIDSRLPSLEDGASWASLLANYRPETVRSERLILKKKETDIAEILQPVSREQRAFNELIVVPENQNIVLSRITAKKSWLGTLINLAYKTSPLEIRLLMKNGAEERYRFVAAMAEGGILISPLIRTAEDFELLYFGRQMLLDKQVASFSIAPARWPLLWQNSLEVEFSAVARDALPATTRLSGLKKPEHYVGSAIAEAAICEGEVSYLNGFPTSAGDITAVKTLSLVGWLAVDSGRGLRSAAAKLILSDESGERYVIPTERRIRRDLVNEYDNQDLVGAGYSASADISRLPRGDYLLSVGYEKRGIFTACPAMQRGISIESDLASVVR